MPEARLRFACMSSLVILAATWVAVAETYTATADCGNEVIQLLQTKLSVEEQSQLKEVEEDVVEVVASQEEKEAPIIVEQKQKMKEVEEVVEVIALQEEQEARIVVKQKQENTTVISVLEGAPLDLARSILEYAKEHQGGTVDKASETGLDAEWGLAKLNNSGEITVSLKHVIEDSIDFIEKTLGVEEAVKQGLEVNIEFYEALNNETDTPEDAAGMVPNGTVMQGDMVVGKEQVLLMQAAAAAGRRWVGELWPNGQVPYCFALDISVDIKEKFREAIQHVQTLVPCLVFEELATAEGYSDQFDYEKACQGVEHAVFVSSSSNGGCYSHIGVVSGITDLNLDPQGCDGFGTVVHEIGHALGMAHEQSRPDRDQYVQILWQNIKSGKEHNFEIATAGYTSLSYDFLSLMHYDERAFGIRDANGEKTQTIQAVAPTHVAMGQDMGFARSDAEQLGEMYGCLSEIEEFKLCPVLENASTCSSEACTCHSGNNAVFFKINQGTFDAPCYVCSEECPTVDGKASTNFYCSCRGDLVKKQLTCGDKPCWACREQTYCPTSFWTSDSSCICEDAEYVKTEDHFNPGFFKCVPPSCPATWENCSTADCPCPTGIKINQGTEAAPCYVCTPECPTGNGQASTNADCSCEGDYVKKQFTCGVNPCWGCRTTTTTTIPECPTADGHASTNPDCSCEGDYVKKQFTCGVNPCWGCRTTTTTTIPECPTADGHASTNPDCSCEGDYVKKQFTCGVNPCWGCRILTTTTTTTAAAGANDCPGPGLCTSRDCSCPAGEIKKSYFDGTCFGCRSPPECPGPGRCTYDNTCTCSTAEFPTRTTFFGGTCYGCTA